jgi:phosphatidate cytidylyltransferase
LALNIQTFKTRALTALLFVVVMLVGLLWNFWSFLVLFTVIHFGCWFEFVKLMKKIYGVKYLGYCLFGLIYITLPCVLIICLYDRAGDVNIHDTFIVLSKGLIPILIIASIWINDTMAYLVGSFIGKTPLSKISPKKTIEGTLGGIILCITVIGLGTYFIYETWTVAFLSMIIAALCAIFGTAGDLLESKLKRMAKVKDSGSFMPGHGGFLDRFDSLLVAVPAVWVFVYFFLN